MNKKLPELQGLKDLQKFSHPLVRSRTLESVRYKDEDFPIISFEIGSKDLSAPTLGLFGGVHGLEKIGTHVICAFLKSSFQRLEWDKDFEKMLETTRIVSIPLVNPVGMAYNFRSNGNGVDLMRNAPVESEDPKSMPLLAGHRLGPWLPWFRGFSENNMEIESALLCQYVQDEMFQSTSTMAVDFHSGFGLKDRFWYPYAKSKKPFPRIQEVRAVKKLLDSTFPHHIYKVEGQSKSYTTHGDLWDYLFDMYEKKENKSKHVFLPWTLEMGSWLWLKKNPVQVFSSEGFFNPIKEHRLDRTMRRHMPLIVFLLNLVRNKDSWQK